MDQIYEQTLLFDIYGELLTEKQKEICRMHLQEDWSLGEISEELGISRQGVYDTVHRALRILQSTETKLHMVERFLVLSAQAGRLQSMIENQASKQELLQQVQELKEAIKIGS